MYKKMIGYMKFIGAFLLMTSCEKTLNAPPTQEKVDKTVVIDQKSAEIALNGIYYFFANVGESNTTGLPSTNWAGSHEAIPAQLAGFLDYFQGATTLSEHKITAQDNFSEQIWTENYKIINAANGVIKGVEELGENKIDPERKLEILGEARFLRAYANLKLLTYYGEYFNIDSKFGVMIRTAPVTVSTINTPRKTVRESYDFILGDLEYAIIHCANKRPNHYASRWAAMLLKMRCLMLRSLAEKIDYSAVITLADKIINESPYKLEGRAQDIFKTKGLASEEVILGTKAFANQVAEGQSYYYRETYLFYPTPMLLNMLKDDPRKEWMVENVSDRMVFTKYLGAQTEAKYAFRLTEAYLLKAVAQLKGGLSLLEIKNTLRIIQAHAGFTTFDKLDAIQNAKEMERAIFYETVLSLVAEDGSDWIALVSLPFEQVKGYNPFISQKWQQYLPVPFAEHEKNPEFGMQNPGYVW